MSETELIPHLFKSEYSKIVAVLCSLLGTEQIQVAEDIAQDTFLAAAQTWGMNGTPANPTAWLYKVAKNKTFDHHRRNKIFSSKVKPAIAQSHHDTESPEPDLSTENITDSQLRMMFVICHPAIAAGSQVALALKILCGFGTREIAAALLIPEDTIQKRIYRAKEKLRTEKISMLLPPAPKMDARLDQVLIILYLLFNEGYYSSASETIRKDLCFDAMRLCHMLISNAATATGSSYGLLSLMCFHASRFDARISGDGQPVLYDDQDRALWDEELIDKGNEFLIEAMKADYIGKYQLEASIAYWHSSKIPHPDKWENILLLYDQLIKIDRSPMVALNRIFAISKAKDKQTAIEAASKLNLPDDQYSQAVLAELYNGIGSER